MKPRYQFNYSALNTDFAGLVGASSAVGGLCLCVIGMFSFLLNLGNENFPQNYLEAEPVSEACANSEQALIQSFDLATASGDEQKLLSFQSVIDNYRNGEGELAPGDRCSFPTLSEKVHTLAL